MKLTNATSILLLPIAVFTAKLVFLEMQQQPETTFKLFVQPCDSINGEIRKFHKSGKIKEIAHFVNGLRDGLTLVYDKKGDLIAEEIYSAGNRNGTCKWLVPGKVSWQVDYREGFRHGKWLYFIKGQKRMEADFNMGRLDGWAYQFHKNGIVSLKCAFREGMLLSSEDRYDAEGYLLSRAYPGKALNRLAMEDKYNKAGEKVKSTVIDAEAELPKFFQASVF
jgi:antitoxin component YwqK of YwqJK toxin-antitoxin module